MSPATSDGRGLDPGASRRRKPMSGCKCLLFSLFAVFVLGIVLSLLFFVTKFSRHFFTPHKDLYHNVAVLDKIENRGSVVQPLVGREHRFDLLVAVWVRSSGMHVEGGNVVGEKKDSKEAEEKREQSENDALAARKETYALAEEPLYSDIVFHNVHLTDKNLHTTVNFTVPTALFRNANLTNYDLRGSVMLVPSSESPSLLDHLTNYSSYIPDGVEMLPVRTWPFPLGSPDISRKKTIQDKALESFGVSVPLIQFHGVQSRCVSVNATSELNVSGSLGSEDSEFDDEGSDDEEYNSDSEDTETHPSPDTQKIAVNTSAPASLLRTTVGKQLLQSHPYIVTRTQIRVLDETKLYNRKAYLRAHKRLKETSCGQGVLDSPSRYYCKGAYRAHGNWETMLQLRVPPNDAGKEGKGEKKSKGRTEWAYAPFLYMSTYAHGQRDLLPVPVTRENCSDGKSNEDTFPDAPELESVDVSWKISYSGRTPAKMNIADLMEKPKWYAFNETEGGKEGLEKVVFEHDSAELANGLVGHRFNQDAHPRRRWLLSFLSVGLSLALTLLSIRYWFTRRSTVGISIPGTALLALSAILAKFDGFLLKAAQRAVLGWIVGAVFTIVTSLIVPITQLKAVLRVDVTWWGWLPTLERAGATHSERASERLEARTSWNAKASGLLLVTAFYYFLAPHEYDVIPAITLKPKPVSASSADPLFFPVYLFLSMRIVGFILQLVMNWRSRSYAGKYRLSAGLKLLLDGVLLAEFVPALVGRFETRGTLNAHRMLEVGINVVDAVQALRWKDVDQAVEDDHIE